MSKSVSTLNKKRTPKISVSLSKLSPRSLAFDELALKPFPSELSEAVKEYSTDILSNDEFITTYTELIKMIIHTEIKKRPNITILQTVLIKEQIWTTATKNLNTLVVNTAAKLVMHQVVDIL